MENALPRYGQIYENMNSIGMNDSQVNPTST